METEESRHTSWNLHADGDAEFRRSDALYDGEFECAIGVMSSNCSSQFGGTYPETDDNCESHEPPVWLQGRVGFYTTAIHGAGPR